MEAKSEILNRVLLKLPGMEQSNPVENTEFIRFRVRLHIHPLDNHYRLPEIFILFTHKDLEQARGTHEGLELAFERNIRQHSFKDEINGKTVETSIQKDHSGVWRALTRGKADVRQEPSSVGQRQRGLRRLICFAQHRKRCGYR